MYLLYSLLLAAALLLGSPYWLFQILRHGKYRRGLGERFGSVPQRIVSSGKRSIWIHAVSVGEVLAVSELIRKLRAEYPEYRIVISTTTDTGQSLAVSRFGAENVFYFPFDFAFCISRYFNVLRPPLVVIAETEFWPNFLRIAKECGARVAVVNARISDRSFPGYRRWRRLLTHVLSAVDVFLAQGPEDAQRLAEIGASTDRIAVAGNLKFDVQVPTAPPLVNRLRNALQSESAGPILVCGSTVEGEEDLLIDAFRNVLSQCPRAVMLLAPRHPERFEPVAGLIPETGIKFFRRSTWDGEPLSGSVLLIDSIGELASLYSLADIAFVGGSLVPRGGHSILEPAQHGVPIVVGPHTENFRDIVNLFRGRNAVKIVQPDNLTDSFIELLANETERLALGRHALETAQSQRGATEVTLESIRKLLKRDACEAHTA